MSVKVMAAWYSGFGEVVLAARVIVICKEERFCPVTRRKNVRLARETLSDVIAKGF